MTLDKATFNNATLNKALDDVCLEWDISGNFIVIQNDEVLHDQVYGFADREKGIPTSRDSRYALSLQSTFLIGFSTLILIDLGLISFETKLSEYIPEYEHGSSITVKHLLKSQTGIPDFFYSHLMLELDADEKHNALDYREKVRVENRVFNENRTFEKVMKIITGKPLTYEPGTSGRMNSQSDWVILGELIRRVTKMSLYDFMSANIFKPLKMTDVQEGNQANTISSVIFRETELISVPVDFEVADIFTASLEDMKKLLFAVAKRGLVSKKMWKRITKLDEEGNGIIVENANGYDCFNIEFLGNGFYFYVNQKTGLGFASLVNEEQKFRQEHGTWYYFRKCSREVLEAVFTYPVNTKMVPLNKENMWDAMNIKVADDQHAYVLEVKASMIMALLNTSKKAYVQMEGNRAVGLLVLDMDKKKNYYNIDIIQIDKRYQGRGYGKLMLKYAIDTLIKSGAKELEIGVNRFNYAAQKIYMDAGFTAKSVFDEGMTLHMIIA